MSSPEGGSSCDRPGKLEGIGISFAWAVPSFIVRKSEITVSQIFTQKDLQHQIWGFSFPAGSQAWQHYPLILSWCERNFFLYVLKRPQESCLTLWFLCCMNRARSREQNTPAALLGMCRVFARGPDGGGKHKYLFVPKELRAAHAHHRGCVWEWGNRSVS